MANALEVREGAALPYHRWSVEDYYRMAEVGLLAPFDRTELIEGELIDMAPIGCKHASWVDRFLAIFARKAPGCLIRVQNPVRLDRYNEPQPDIALVRDKSYMDAHPVAEDVYLIVEVADASLQFDREVKLPLYARHGIPEVWLLDVNASELTVFRDPAEGQYRSILKPDLTEPIAPQALPQAVVTLAEIAQ
jgi:Uma2 family endonuclease